MLGKYYFKHEYWGDEWQEYNHHEYDEAFCGEEVAENLAKYLFHQDPCNPMHFEFICEVKLEDWTGKYKVTAEADVNFYTNKVRE